MLKFSENKPERSGKRVSSMGRQFKNHQFDLGTKEWKNDNVSITKYFHNEKKFVPNTLKLPYFNNSKVEFNIKDKTYDEDKKKSLYASNFRAFNDARPSKSILTKTDLLKTTFILGEFGDPVTTTAHHFNDRVEKGEKFDVVRNPRSFAGYRPYPDKFNIITGSDVEPIRREKTWAYEFFNERKPKKYISYDKSDFQPKNDRIDIITGRRLKF
eukprot:TRINITY_DN13583_c0_g1_i2.p1 TRINITY_DN13583_c0_g1~~TRINITY_DN13583_c0_g1_i2.p1  ORF type:complete len:213 (+),score=52.21 TRINITY_DN13583_c0_g1_i2:53-691(+)